jgi:3-hydroxyphenylacetate 6-hydroxylase
MFEDNPILQLLLESLRDTTLIERITITLTIGPILVFFVYELNRLSVRVPQFEGPFGLPVVGNIWQLGRDPPEQYRQWAKKYGGVYQVQLGSIPVLVVNTAAAAKVIFGENSSAVTSRPEFYTFHKIVSDTSGTTIGTSPHTESLKKRRKATASALNKPAVQSYIPHLDEETRVFIAEIWKDSNGGKQSIDPIPMIQRLNLSLGLTMNWGTRMERHDDSLLREVTHVEDEISKLRSTNQNLQDYIPLLRLNPFSLQSERAKEMRTRRDKYMDKLDSDLAMRMEHGTQEPCIQANILNDPEATLSKQELSSINVTMIAAGLDTMISAVSWGFACLADRPDIQEEALKAIREHHPADQPLCDANDDQQCQYLNYFIKEVLRHYTMARLSLPRRSVKDFVYEEKLIPAGTILFLNAWACNMGIHLPIIFPQPNHANPTPQTKPTGPTPNSSAPPAGPKTRTSNTSPSAWGTACAWDSNSRIENCTSCSCGRSIASRFRRMDRWIVIR